VSLLHLVERSITAERLVVELEGAFAAAWRPAEGAAHGQPPGTGFASAATVLRRETGYPCLEEPVPLTEYAIYLRGVGRMSTSGKVGTSNLVCR
jgi:hypothetical protein